MGSGIEAHDRADRVDAYDRDMDIMHPNRHRMVEVALEILPHPTNAEFTVLELGAGTGLFTKALLESYPRARVVAVDGAKTMVKVAQERLGSLADRVDFRVSDFRELDTILEPSERGDLVISAYALHHVALPEKTAVVRRCVEFLRPGGWFLNADIIIGGTGLLEERYQDLRVAGIVERTAEDVERFQNADQVKRYLADLEREHDDQPQTVEEELRVLRKAGLENCAILWLEYREAVICGTR